jgi:hypothetical protein
VRHRKGGLTLRLDLQAGALAPHFHAQSVGQPIGTNQGIHEGGVGFDR